MTRESKEAKPELKTFGDRLRCVRKGKQISQKVLAKKLGYKASASISKIEGDISPPDFTKLPQIAAILNVDLHWLITGEERPIKTINVATYNADTQPIVDILQPYVEAYLGTVFESSARTQEEITELEMFPDRKTYNGEKPAERVAYLRKLLRQELKYYGRVMDDLKAVGML